MRKDRVNTKRPGRSGARELRKFALFYLSSKMNDANWDQSDRLVLPGLTSLTLSFLDIPIFNQTALCSFNIFVRKFKWILRCRTSYFLKHCAKVNWNFINWMIIYSSEPSGHPILLNNFHEFWCAFYQCYNLIPESCSHSIQSSNVSIGFRLLDAANRIQVIKSSNTCPKMLWELTFLWMWKYRQSIFTKSSRLHWSLLARFRGQSNASQVHEDICQP